MKPSAELELGSLLELIETHLQVAESELRVHVLELCRRLERAQQALVDLEHRVAGQEERLLDLMLQVHTNRRGTEPS
ncbi:MAG: hypothetical protein JNM69_37895 [Archangium sp.]|nr:hypothetical protein [Archangium sp.]